MKISKGAVIRTALLALALTNQVLAGLGRSPLPFESETLSELVSLLFTAGAAAAAWWKNNSFTQAAIIADKKLDELRAYKL